MPVQAWLRSLKPRKTSTKAWDRSLETACSEQLDGPAKKALHDTLQAWNAICSLMQQHVPATDQVQAFKTIPKSIVQHAHPEAWSRIGSRKQMQDSA